MRRDDDRDMVKQMLRDRIGDLCARLLPDGKRQGRLWVAHNPITLDHAQSPEFKVAMDRDTGAWIDYRSGARGDVIRLVEYCMATDFAGAMRWSRDFLGLVHMDRAARQKAEDQARAARQQQEAKAEQDHLFRMKRAEKLFMDGWQDGSGSTAEHLAREYFTARACGLEDVVNRDRETMRFSAATEYWRRAQYRHENGRQVKVAAGPTFPAIHSAMRAPGGQVTAVHVTFLDPVSPKKAPVAPDSAKLMFGEASGSMIRIAHGPEGEPPETARQAHPLILCEGIEDGLSLAIAAPEARVWAAGSLSMMGLAPVNLPCVSAVIVARDNDWGKAQAQAQFDQVLDRIAAHGKQVRVIASHAGKDFNDLAQGIDDE